MPPEVHLCQEVTGWPPVCQFPNPNSVVLRAWVGSQHCHWGLCSSGETVVFRAFAFLLMKWEMQPHRSLKSCWVTLPLRSLRSLPPPDPASTPCPSSSQTVPILTRHLLRGLFLRSIPTSATLWASHLLIGAPDSLHVCAVHLCSCPLLAAGLPFKALLHCQWGPSYPPSQSLVRSEFLLQNPRRSTQPTHRALRSPGPSVLCHEGVQGRHGIPHMVDELFIREHLT